ncbi:LPS export ABC transporter periplasmic protein LptC [Thalassotalea euphylliae]|uniref:Lipopolysaccharide export system protein LptC n=1 Tax=Thalassotalea euphylliae TaxID=1655234 RepID=A0A3E0UCW3_9GAMM|nr:LPS export ABC transporter periplasmic protein LptC [Thalassotalea euphylliae]REL34423.1 LPS export ABC transporter periplasmic protein LptC [Thalassotalea euphylliae]
MNRLYGLALIAFLFSLMAYGVVQWRQAQQQDADIVEAELVPDFIAEALNSDIYSESGQLSHHVNAERMEHYAELAFTHFEQPKYTVYPKNDSAPWQLEALEGTLYNNNRVVLKNRVTLMATEPDSLIKEIHCKYLELDLNTNIISSDQTILIQGKDFTMYGSGLIIDLNTKQMTLTEHVQTIYKKAAS